MTIDILAIFAVICGFFGTRKLQLSGGLAGLKESWLGWVLLLVSLISLMYSYGALRGFFVAIGLISVTGMLITLLQRNPSPDNN